MYDAVPSQPAVEDESARLLMINHKGSVPALMVGDQLSTENLAIIFYADVHPISTRLLPNDPFDKARCLPFLAWRSNTAHIAFRQWARPDRFSFRFSRHEKLTEDGKRKFWSHLEEIDDRLADQDYLMGNQFTAADCYGLVFYVWGDFADLPARNLTCLTRFKQMMIQRPAVRRVLRREQSDLLSAQCDHP